MVELGYSAIPIVPGDKMPGAYMGGEWRPQNGWTKFCNNVPPPFQVKSWESWPDAGLGVACGRGLIAFDIDQDHLVEPVCAVLPETPVMKKGRKGLTLFFKGDTDNITNRSFKIDGLGALDLLSHGKQTVLPPSVHPITHVPYEWTGTATLADTPLSDLPEVTAKHIENVIAVLVAFGHEPKNQEMTWNDVGGRTPVVARSGNGDRSPTRQLNDDAMANLHAWVPKLADVLPKLRKVGSKYEAVNPRRASGTGRPLSARAPNLKFHPTGIKDQGSGKTYTPVNAVMEMRGLERDDACRWLGERLGYDFRAVFDIENDDNPPPRPGSVPEADAETIWNESGPIADTPAAAYLRSWCLTPPAFDTIRYHEAMGAIVSLAVLATGQPVAVCIVRLDDVGMEINREVIGPVSEAYLAGGPCFVNACGPVRFEEGVQ